MKSTYSVIFYLKREKLKKDGTYPVMGRITVDGTQCQFSCKVNCSPDLWEIKGGRAIGKSVMARNVNMELDKIKARIDKYYKEIVDRDNFVTAEKVKNAFLGLEFRQQTLMTTYTQWIANYEKQGPYAPSCFPSSPSSSQAWAWEARRSFPTGRRATTGRWLPASTPALSLGLAFAQVRLPFPMLVQIVRMV